MSNTLTLATRLRALDDRSLTSALAARELPRTASSLAAIKDFFDLADALLDHASIQQALTRLDRETLAVLALLAEATTPLTPQQAADGLAELRADAPGPGIAPSDGSLGEKLDATAALLLVNEIDGAFTCYDGVREQLRSWPVFGLPSLQELATISAPAALEPVPDVDGRFIDRLAAERAFAATSAVTELLLELERQPARELAKGGIALPDAKRLASTMSVDLESVAVYLSLAERGFLVGHESGTWMTTEAGNDWLAETTPTRWRELAAAWFGRLPDDIRRLLGERAHSVWGDGLRSYVDWLYPAGGEWMDGRITVFTRDAELLGITAAQTPSGPGALIVAGHDEAAHDSIRSLLPAEVDSVYLQHDLSVVAPGPLLPHIDTRMRMLADVESRALATTYRISSSSVNRALTAGETAESLREFLASISKTGIPQPLDYLITEGSARYGLLRAGALTGEGVAPDSPDFGARSYVRSDDPRLVTTLLVDQSLASLGLVGTGPHRVVSRFALDIVFWSLSDARYPVAAEDASGQIMALRRHRVARTVPKGSADPVAELIERLRLEAEGNDSGEVTGVAWLAKQLEAAVRAKTAVAVSIAMPDGSVVEYELEPTSIAGGRMRARDSKSEIERTLPLASIVGLRPLER